MSNKVAEIYKNISGVFNKKLKSKADRYERGRVIKSVSVRILNTLSIICLVLFVVVFFLPPVENLSFAPPQFLNAEMRSIWVAAVPMIAFLFITPLPYIFFAVIFAVLSQFIKLNYVLKTKNEFYPEVIKLVGPQLKYIPGKVRFAPIFKSNNGFKGISLNFIQDTVSFLVSLKNKLNINIDAVKGINILPEYENFSCSDVIKGIYNGKSIEIIEFDLLKNHKKDKIWSGIAFQTHLDKKFDSKLVITYRGNTSLTIRGLDKVIFDSEEFNKIYRVLGPDQTETEHIVVNTLMAKLMDIYNCGQQISVYIEDNDVTVFVETKHDMFEPDINIPVNNVSSYLEVLNQTYCILKFITTLDLTCTEKD